MLAAAADSSSAAGAVLLAYHWCFCCVLCLLYKLPSYASLCHLHTPVLYLPAHTHTRTHFYLHDFLFLPYHLPLHFIHFGLGFVGQDRDHAFAFPLLSSCSALTWLPCLSRTALRTPFPLPYRPHPTSAFLPTYHLPSCLPCTPPPTIHTHHLPGAHTYLLLPLPFIFVPFLEAPACRRGVPDPLSLSSHSFLIRIIDIHLHSDYS